MSKSAYCWLLMCCLGWGCNTKPTDVPGPELPNLQPLTDARIINKVETFCGNCHGVPDPTTIPRAQWPAEVEQGYKFYHDAQRVDLEEPLVRDTLRYFQSRATEKVVVPDADTFSVLPSSLKFRPSPLIMSDDDRSMTTDILWDANSKSLLFSDMQSGKLRRWNPSVVKDLMGMEAQTSVLLPAESSLLVGKHLCRINPVDWNRDGIQDYVLGEIGSTQISDQKLGCISLVIAEPTGELKRYVLIENLARPVAGVPFDYDDDGDLDILIPEFGRHAAGCVSLLRNQSPANANPADLKFDYEVIDQRHGALGIEVADMNGDGKQDIVIAFGQEFETIEILTNEGDGKYSFSQVIRFPDPSYNSSSIRVADIDQDGKPDIVHTSGDIFDSFVPKTFHGVRVLHQTSDGWEVIDLGMLIGAMHSAVADFDLDGDLDVAAVGLFPHEDAKRQSYDSVVWWEQTEGLKFVRHSIERDHCLHTACTAADIDNDGRPDLIAGEWTDGDQAPSLRIFWNVLNK